MLRKFPHTLDGTIRGHVILRRFRTISKAPLCRVLAAGLALAAGLSLALALSPPAHAQSLIEELKLGVLYHDAPNMWSGFRQEPQGVDINVEALLRPSLPLFLGTIRPALGATISTRGDTNHAYLGARWQVELPIGVFFGLGLGAAVHDGHTLPDSASHKALGSRVLFHIPAEIGVRLDRHNSLSIYFEHTSNAGLANHNEGMDRIGLRYGYKF